MNHAPKLPLVYAINLLPDFFFSADIVEVTQLRVEDKDSCPPL